MPRTEIPNPTSLAAALQAAGTDLIITAGMILNESINGRRPPADALHSANMAIGTVRDAIAAYERSRRPIAA